MDLVKFLDLVIRLPDGGQTGGLCSHNVNADSEICAQSRNSRPYKFHYFILHIAAAKYFSYDRKSHILRAYSLNRLSGQINSHNSRHINVIGLAKKLLYQLGSAFSHCHGSKRSVSCMRIRPQDHPAAACKHFSGKLMDDCLMRRNINAAVLFRTGQSKHVVILINSSAHCAQGIVAVCKHIGHWKFLKSRCSGGLDNSHESDIM